MTLRSRLTLAFVLVVLTPLLVGLVLLTGAVPQAARDQQVVGLEARAGLVGQLLADYCARARTTAEAVGRAGGSTDRGAVVRAARSVVDRGLADGVRVYRADGRLVTADGPVPQGAADCAGEPARAGIQAYLSAVAPLTTAQGTPAGTAVASFALDPTVVTRLRQSAGRATVVLTDPAGNAVAGRASEVDVRRALAGVTHLGGGVLAGRAVPVVGQPFGVVLFEQSARTPSLLARGLGVAALAASLAAGLALLLARAVTRPLEEVSRAAASIAGGDLSTSIAVRSRDEVGRLALAFNAMTDELRGYVGQLQASRDDLQAGLARLGDTLSSTHDLDRILSVVLESAMAATRAGSGMLLLLNPARDALVPAASRGLDLPVDLRVPLGEGVSGRVAQTGEPVRGRIGDGPGELPPGPGEPSGTSLIAVPLLSHGTVVGVLDLYGAAAPGGFDEADLATMRTFAGQATVAVDNVLLHEEAQRLSLTDGMTGLWNYRYFTMTVGKEIERAARFGRPLGLLMLDLDHFKTVNDTFGHQRGDAVLVELARRVRECVRDVDTVARYGGEEIVVVLPETDESGARHLAERLCDAVRRRPFGGPGEQPIALTVSAGVAVFPRDGTSAGLLLGQADEALYEAKRAGRDQWRAVQQPPAPH